MKSKNMYTRDRKRNTRLLDVSFPLTRRKIPPPRRYYNPLWGGKFFQINPRTSRNRFTAHLSMLENENGLRLKQILT